MDLSQFDFLTRSLITYDPYDLWKTKFGMWLKRVYYTKGKITTPLIVPFVVLNTYAPQMVRRFIKPQEYPTVRAFAVLTALNLYEITDEKTYLAAAEGSVRWLISNPSPGYHGACWGLNFPWMARFGYSPPETPFITSTPYCVEALFKYHVITKEKEALSVALSSLDFIEKNLRVLLDSNDELALSYGPRQEGRRVINANSYAMMMYALLANWLPEHKSILQDKARRVYNFVRNRQDSDGKWYYYDGVSRGNFIDCFHSCFVIKNLIKYGRLSGVDVSNTVKKGIEYIINNFLDQKKLLARKFLVSADPSLVRFDLYDQAELLNLLCMLNYRDLARGLCQSIFKHFYIPAKKSFAHHIDIFGIRNNMIYLRWAVMPMLYALSEYYKLSEYRPRKY